MGRHKTVKAQIVEAVRSAPGCHIEDLVMSCPQVSWKEIFVEVDRLNRTGKLRVTSADHGAYVLDLPKRRRRRESASNSTNERNAAAAGRLPPSGLSVRLSE